MAFRSKIYKFVAAASLIAALSSHSLADTLRLKDGSIIKGKITAFTGGKFTIVMGEGSRRRELTFFATEVESIRFDDGSTTAGTAAPTRRTDPAPALPQITDRTTSDRTASQQPVLKQAPRVIPTSATGSQPGRVDPPRPTPNTTMKPIAWDVKVLADNTNNGWTNTGWVVKKGQKVRITGDGSVSLGKGKTSTPSGDPDIQDAQKLLKNVATGALLAVIGDDNNDFIYIGAEREFTASRDGALFLGINEGYLDDNKGAYSVKVEIIPDGQ